jgi:3-oxoacyl-[acyl-carrier protein] reductase
VTGAGAGLGKAIAERFADEGARVAVLDIDEDAARSVADGIARNGGKAIARRADVSDDESVQEAFSAVRGEWDGLDVLVNNAGIAQRPAPAVETPQEDIDRILAVNVRGIFHTTRHALEALRASEGTILNIASNAALRPRPGMAWYNASKGAVVNLTLSLAAEFAHQRVRVNAIAPAVADTTMKRFILGDDPGGQLEQATLSTIPLGRLTQGTDVASAAVFLASDEASFITGVVLPVDGGRMVA